MTDKGTIRLVIVLLGLFAILGLAGVVYLIDGGTSAALVAVVSTPMGVALGSLGTMLASTRTVAEPIVPVQVVNPPAQPVPVAEQPAA